MPIDWNLLKTPDIAGAFQTGLQNGQAQAKDRATRGALANLASNPDDPHAANALIAVAPEFGYKVREQQRESQSRSAMAAVFTQPTPAGPGAVPSALGAYGPGQGMPSALTAPAPDMPPGAGITPANPVVLPVSAAPTTLVDPSRLPPRTDGLSINQEALRHLYQIDAPSAFKVQQMVHDADAASFKRIQQNGATMAQVAYRLASIKDAAGNADLAARQRELVAMQPQLTSMGLTPEMISQADVSDTGLNRYLMMGRSITDLTRDDRAERQLDWNIEDDRADNGRADRSESRQEYYRARSDSRSERSDSRQAVRFRERDKDRAALAGTFGIRADTSDLDY